MDERKKISGELMLTAAMLCNSFCNIMLVKSGFGVPPITSVPYAVSLIFQQVTYGVWTYIYQGMLIIILAIAVRKFDFNYILSFGLAVVYGYMVDFFSYILRFLPDAAAFRFLYLAIGFMGMSFGITLMLKCNMPVLPIDNVTRDIPKHFNITVKIWKTSFDLICVIISLALSMAFIGDFRAVGLGTVFNALFTGKLVGMIAAAFDRRYTCEAAIPFFARFSWKDQV